MCKLPMAWLVTMQCRRRGRLLVSSDRGCMKGPVRRYLGRVKRFGGSIEGSLPLRGGDARSFFRVWRLFRFGRALMRIPAILGGSATADGPMSATTISASPPGAVGRHHVQDAREVVGHSTCSALSAATRGNGPKGCSAATHFLMKTLAARRRIMALAF